MAPSQLPVLYPLPHLESLIRSERCSGVAVFLRRYGNPYYLHYMADEQPKKATTKKPRAKKYNEKLAIKGSFLDIIQAAAKDANKKKE